MTAMSQNFLLRHALDHQVKRAYAYADKGDIEGVQNCQHTAEHLEAIAGGMLTPRLEDGLNQFIEGRTA